MNTLLESKFDSSKILNFTIDLCIDVKLLIYSYLSLEEILTIFSSNLSTRDKIIRLYFKELPDIDLSIENGNLETLKYLHEKGLKLNELMINDTSYYGHLELLKYLCENGMVPTNDAMNLATTNGHLEVVKYLYQLGIEPTKWTLHWARLNVTNTINGKERLELLSFIESKMID